MHPGQGDRESAHLPQTGLCLLRSGHQALTAKCEPDGLKLLGRLDLGAGLEVLGQAFKHPAHHARTEPLQEMAMTGLVRGVAVGQSGPGHARVEYVEDSKTSRRPRRGRPRRSCRGVGSGISGSRSAHSASVRSRCFSILTFFALLVICSGSYVNGSNGQSDLPTSASSPIVPGPIGRPSVRSAARSRLLSRKLGASPNVRFEER